MDREAFVLALRSVSPSLMASSKIIDQSDNFVFRDNEVSTFNDELCCRCRLPTGFDEKFSGAVPAKKLLEQLAKWSDKQISVASENGRLNIASGKRKTWLRYSKDISLPVHQIDRPDKWLHLAQGFVEAVDTVRSCVSSDKSKWQLMCVHIHSDRVEATDIRQICRWKLNTGFKKPVLVKNQALSCISLAAPDRFAESSNWLHLRNKESGLVMNCRRYADVQGYPDLGSHLELHKGQTISLEFVPPDEIEKAAVFSSENEKNYITLQVDESGKTRISSEGITGGYSGKSFPLKGWKGKPVSFQIAPGILLDVVKKYPEVQVGLSASAAKKEKSPPNRLKATAHTYEYVTTLIKAG